MQVIQDTLIFFIDCLTVAIVGIFFIVSLYLIIDRILPWAFKEIDKDNDEAKALKRFASLQSLQGALLVHLNNGSQFAAIKVIDLLPAGNNAHDDFVIFLTANDKKKYARFSTIDLVEEQDE